LVIAPVIISASKRKDTGHPLRNWGISFKRLVIDALRSRECSPIELPKALCITNRTDEVNIVATEVNAKKTVRITMLGSNLNHEEVTKPHGGNLSSFGQLHL